MRRDVGMWRRSRVTIGMRATTADWARAIEASLAWAHLPSPSARIARLAVRHIPASCRAEPRLLPYARLRPCHLQHSLEMPLLDRLHRQARALLRDAHALEGGVFFQGLQ